MSVEIDEKLVRDGIGWIEKTHDSPEILEVVEAARAYLLIHNKTTKSHHLSDEDRSELRGWAQMAAVRPKTDMSRWVAEKVLILLRENFNLKHHNKNSN